VVARLEPFGDQPLQLLFLDHREQFVRVDVLGGEVPRDRDPGTADRQVGQQLPAPRVRRGHQHLLTEPEQVEHDVGDRRGPQQFRGRTTLMTRLHELEVRPSVLAQHHQLAVEHGRSTGQRLGQDTPQIRVHGRDLVVEGLVSLVVPSGPTRIQQRKPSYSVHAWGVVVPVGESDVARHHATDLSHGVGCGLVSIE
jgi:hypothetical protein